MKRWVSLSILIGFTMICGCEKPDPAGEAKLAQRKAELDAREKALDAREKVLGDWEKALTRSRAIPSDHQVPKPAVDSEQAKAERERRIQQLPPELQALIRDRSLLGPRSDKDTSIEDRAAEVRRRIEEARSRKMNTMTSPNTDASETQSTSPAPSPTPE